MIENLTIKDVVQGIKRKEFSVKEVFESYLKRAKDKNKELNSFISFNENIKDLPEQGSLLGVPFSVKDSILVKGMPCTCASKMLENYQAVYNATCIERLKRQGALILGKTNLDEFSMGSSSEHSIFGRVKNPHDLERVAGGTSGGSAVSVFSDQSVFSLGADTGGSIRQPASFCGVVGLKPTYGAVSRYGLVAHASSLDQIGPLCKNVDDAEIVFDIIKGRDEKDSTSIDLKEETFPLTETKVGVPKEYFSEGLEKGVKEVIEKVLKKAEEQGVKIQEVSLPHSKYALPCYYIISTSEASANLARFDGIRYGLSIKGKDLWDGYFKTKGEGFGDEVKRRIMLGSFCLSSGYYDAYYLKAQKVRTLIKDDFEEVFKKVDFIFGPVSPFPAFKAGERLDDPLKMYLADIYTVSLNLAGLPGISVPVGKTNNLPVGLQIISSPFSEKRIFKAAKLIESIC